MTAEGTMKHLLEMAAVAGLALALAPLPAEQAQQTPQTPRYRVPAGQEDTKLPDGKSQQEEILKADHEKDLKDAAQLIELAEQLKQDLEKNDRHVLSISSLKKTEEIEKLAKRIHSRLVH
jgi:hypothetical protein